ncbi:MAG: TM0106 family RecB-like putative nuclease [Bdellovibrionaceae bacterium]|nr:TM0106 family RecB-like putative nuclease [Pseudobdellovibrionaceae bacterium]NUM58074.1 TM0106 family RecB-like putative nuclease [Pseudobdellovibrionaceae bacterium]
MSSNNKKLFKNYIHCEYKAYLIHIKQIEELNALEFHFARETEYYISSIPDNIAHQKISTKNQQSNVFTPVEYSTKNKIDISRKIELGYQAINSGIPEKKLSKYGVIIYGLKYLKTKIQLKKYSNLAKKIAGEVSKIENETNIPVFRLCSHCRVCRFQSFCRQKAIQSDDLSLISGLSKKEILKLNKRGLFTVTQLGHSFSPQKRRMKANTKHLFSLKALAIKDKKIYVNHVPKLPSSLVNICLDVEGLFENELYYLIGLKIITPNGFEEKCWWADGALEERLIWQNFLDKVLAFKDFTIFHFGSYEIDFLKKMYGKYGGCLADDYEKICKSMVNILTLCHLNIYFPTYTNGLKDVAGYLNFIWNRPEASGLMSIIWRKNWEKSGDDQLKRTLIQYNADDCNALSVVVDMIYKIIANAEVNTEDFIRADKMKKINQYRWGRNTFASTDFNYVNQCAYFDYQKAKIYWRTDNRLKKRIKLREREERRKYRPNQYITFSRPTICPHCSHNKVNVHDKISRTVIDLKFTRTGIKRWIVNGSGNRYRCVRCWKVVYPADYFQSSFMYGRNLMVWVVYLSIGLKISHESILNSLNEAFGFRFNNDFVTRFKTVFSKYYNETYEEIRENIQKGNLVHVDETRISIRGATGYIWVFSNFKNVYYAYSESREGKILQETLGPFKGVLISDFFAAYDSIECPQQRCLIHLIRDVNDDFLKHQFDKEFKTLVESFGQLMKTIIETVDKRGLKKYFLKKHLRDVERFYKNVVDKEATSEMVLKYKTRFQKNRQRLFTFLTYDGVPWNNNSAENAIKGFATFRSLVGGLSTEISIRESLILLSVAQTLKNNDASFLKFMKAEEKSINAFLSKEKGSNFAFRRMPKKIKST